MSQQLVDARLAQVEYERRNGTPREDPALEALSAIHNKILDGEVAEGIQELLPLLQGRRLRSSEPAWREFIGKCLAHPLRDLVHQDPFTYRTFSKPRGYSGDAVMLDYIYGRDEGWPVPEGTTALGEKIFQCTTGTDTCEAVRARRGYIANLVDRLADETPNPHVLAVASGHLREAMLCSTIRRRRFNRYIALDSDPVSLEEVKRCYGRFGVQTCNASVRQLLSRRLDIGLFDLIYSTGLFDYLQVPAARRLTACFFEFLRPRGRLLIANFLPGILGAGYMEAYMDWKLIFRTQMDMLAMADEISLQSIHDIRIFAEENQNIIFLQITKR